MSKERPILFNGDMVRALLNGRKTQTRRIVKPAKDRNGSGCHLSPCEVAGEINAGDYFLCPYGQPGDRLWVRETHGYEIRSLGGTPHEKIVYRASNPEAVECYDCNGMEMPMKWKPSIFMPRQASRITLEIVSVRVERLQDISNEDAVSEGVGTPLDMRYAALEEFKPLWESINGTGSWADNPWVWVVEFKRAEVSQ